MRLWILLIIFLTGCAGNSSIISCHQPLLFSSSVLSGDYFLVTYDGSLSVECQRVAKDIDYWVNVGGIENSLSRRAFIGTQEISIDSLNKSGTDHNHQKISLIFVLPISASPSDLIWISFEGEE